MKYIKKHPKKSKWKLVRVKFKEYNGRTNTYADKIGIRALDYSIATQEQADKWKRARENNEKREFQYPGPIKDGEEQENFIFFARLKYEYYSRGQSSVAHHFKDVDDGYVFEMPAKASSLFISELANGKIKVVDGCFEGLFTFAKQGEVLSILPYTED